MANKTPQIYYRDVHGLRTKSMDVAEFVASSPVQYIYCLTETWFNSYCYSCDYFPLNYTVFRADRVSDNSHDVRGGGVLIAVPGVYHSVRRFDLESSDCCIWVQIRIGRTDVLVGVYYMCPGISLEMYCAPFQFIEGKLSRFQREIYVCGDFNLPRVNWLSDDCNDCTPIISSKFTALRSFAMYARLGQLNAVPNRFGVMIDLVFSNVLEYEVMRCALACTAEVVYHPALIVSLIKCQ